MTQRCPNFVIKYSIMACNLVLFLEYIRIKMPHSF
jgi:hypothetical protein